MGKTYKGVPQQWGPRPRKPQYAPTIEEELNDMSAEEIYIIVSEWKPVDSPYDLEETVAHHRTEAGAKATLRSIAEGVNVDLRELGDDATNFEIDGPGKHTEWTTWYITTAILED